MASELQLYADPAVQSGLTVIARVYNTAGAQVGADVSCPEVGSLAIYIGNMPVAPAGEYAVRFFSGTDCLAQSELYWDGSAEHSIFTIGEDVDALGGGGGSQDWSAAEREQIRFRLGLDGTATAPAVGDPDLATADDVAAVSVQVAAVDLDVDAIKAKTDLMNFTGGGLDANIIAVTGSAVADVTDFHAAVLTLAQIRDEVQAVVIAIEASEAD